MHRTPLLPTVAPTACVPSTVRCRRLHSLFLPFFSIFICLIYYALHDKEDTRLLIDRQEWNSRESADLQRLVVSVEKAEIDRDREERQNEADFHGEAKGEEEVKEGGDIAVDEGDARQEEQVLDGESDVVDAGEARQEEEQVKEGENNIVAEEEAEKSEQINGEVIGGESKKQEEGEAGENVAGVNNGVVREEANQVEQVNAGGNNVVVRRALIREAAEKEGDGIAERSIDEAHIAQEWKDEKNTEDKLSYEDMLASGRDAIGMEEELEAAFPLISETPIPDLTLNRTLALNAKTLSEIGSASQAETTTAIAHWGESR